jgi:2-haloacid dehalogenase
MSGTRGNRPGSIAPPTVGGLDQSKDESGPGNSSAPTSIPPIQGALFDLLMAVMDSVSIWTAAARETQRGLAWRDAVTARMAASRSYAPYEELVAASALEIGLPEAATSDLFAQWRAMRPWPDTAVIGQLTVPFAFVTNCSTRLAEIAARRSGLRPQFTLAAEEVGWYKPDARVYRLACDRLGVPPEKTLFVAGSVYDGEGAYRAGLRASLIARRRDQRPPDGPIPILTSVDDVVASLTLDAPPGLV